MEKCCQKSLFRKEAKHCFECGSPLHRSLAGKEELFFQVSAFLDQHQAIDFVEDYDEYGDLALD